MARQTKCEFGVEESEEEGRNDFLQDYIDFRLLRKHGIMVLTAFRETCTKHIKNS